MVSACEREVSDGAVIECRRTSIVDVDERGEEGKRSECIYRLYSEGSKR